MTSTRRSGRVTHRISQRKSTYDFLKENVTYLADAGKRIFRLEKHNPLPTYSANKLGKRWWTVIKEVAINHYIGAYLHILDKQRREKGMKLFFLDLTASKGLCEIKGTPNHYFPGSALLAALHNETNNHFDKLFLCDLEPTNRTALRKRLDNLNAKVSNEIAFEICDLGNSKKVDSNAIIEDILQKMQEESNGFYNALVVCDNAGFDIKFPTLEKIHTTHSFTDFIINLPISCLKRQWGLLRGHSSMDSEFAQFCNFPPDSVGKNQIGSKYVEGLKHLGKAHVEELVVRGGRSVGSFHYIMLFAVRNTSGQASWMTLIRKLRERFANVTGDKIKALFDIFYGSQKTLTQL